MLWIFIFVFLDFICFTACSIYELIHIFYHRRWVYRTDFKRIRIFDFKRFIFIIKLLTFPCLLFFFFNLFLKYWVDSRDISIEWVLLLAVKRWKSNIHMLPFVFYFCICWCSQLFFSLWFPDFLLNFFDSYPGGTSHVLLIQFRNFVRLIIIFYIIVIVILAFM